jgi:prepilin-type N-terminal cleavage/methylation domain-containing protein
MGEQETGRAARRGMTLVELLFTMTLIAVVLGVGLGALATLDLGARASVGVVQSMLRQADNWAVARRAPARVRIDPARGVIRAEGMDVIGTWHFEELPPRGAFRLDGSVVGAELVEDGFIGKALTFHGLEPGARHEIEVQRDPSYAITTGFQVHCALRPEKVASGRVLRLGGSVGIDVTSRLGLEVFFSAERVDEFGQPVAAGKATLETPAGVLRPDRWNRITVSYDQSELVVLVEGVAVARVEENARVAKIDRPLVLGGGRRPWPGSIDNLVITAVGSEREVVLPGGTSFPADTPTEIVFAAGGGLDRTVHNQPVRIMIDFENGQRHAVQVNLFGTVE